MARCDKCNTVGHAHVIDSPYRSNVSEQGEPILTTRRKRHFLCTNCSRKIRLEHGLDHVKEYLHGNVVV